MWIWLQYSYSCELLEEKRKKTTQYCNNTIDQNTTSYTWWHVHQSSKFLTSQDNFWTSSQSRDFNINFSLHLDFQLVYIPYRQKWQPSCNSQLFNGDDSITLYQFFSNTDATRKTNQRPKWSCIVQPCITHCTKSTLQCTIMLNSEFPQLVHNSSLGLVIIFTLKFCKYHNINASISCQIHFCP